MHRAVERGGKSPPSVLIIIVNYKSAALTLECVRSLEPDLRSPDVDVRVVVVENDSGDERVLREGLMDQERVELLVARQNGGFSSGNNLGIRSAYESDRVPDYFHLLNPDTRAYPGAVRELAKFMEAQKDVGITGSSIENGDGSDWPIAFRFPTIAGEIDLGLRLGLATRVLDRWVVSRRMGKQPEQVDWLPGASMMIRRGVIERVGAFDEGYFLYFEETDFCLKARRAGFTSWYVPQSRIVHLAGQSTGVTAPGAQPKRLPGYWFESRRRFFVKNHGTGYAALLDAVFSAAWTLGWVKRIAQRRAPDEPERFLYDLLRHSPLLPQNRRVDPERCFFPRR